MKKKWYIWIIVGIAILLLFLTIILTVIFNKKEKLVGTSIKNTILTSFPDLALGSNGCEVTKDTNYSYMNGCYLKGNQDNYVWYSGFLWHIMGINSDNSIRLISANNITVIPYNNEESNSFDSSYVDDWLNNYFYGHLKNTNIIKEEPFCEGQEMVESKTRNNCNDGTLLTRKIGLISIDEYGLAGTDSYLNNNSSFITMSPYENNKMWIVNVDGSNDVNSSFYPTGVRPVINVNNDTIITNGNGALDNPYILNQELTDITGLLKDKATSGEYVKYADKTYRVVSIDTNGNTKIVLDDYYDNEDGYVNPNGVENLLKNNIINYLVKSDDTTNLNKLVTDYSWYKNEFKYGISYTSSLNEEANSEVFNNTVGLLRIGEMLSATNSNLYSYWTMNSYNDISYDWFIGNGNADYGDESFVHVLKPVIAIKADTFILSGNGTLSNPYQI